MIERSNPRVTDDDKDRITVTLNGIELRGWSYANDDERRQKKVQAREYVEGWCDGYQRHRLHAHEESIRNRNAEALAKQKADNSAQ